MKETHAPGPLCPGVALMENMRRTDALKGSRTPFHVHTFHLLKHTLAFLPPPVEVSRTAARVMMDVLYLLSSRQLLGSVDTGTGKAIGQHTLYPPPPRLSSVCVCACVSAHSLALVLSPTKVPPAENSGPHPPFPSAPPLPSPPSACRTDRRSCHGDG